MATKSKTMGKKGEDIADIFRSVFFGEKKKPKKRTSPTQEKTAQSGSDETQIALLRSIAANARISAKNSMALPAILQQTNIMQKNVAKLVRLQGASPTSKADAFFSSSKFRENAYESTYKKGLGENKSPTPEKPVEKKNLLGFFGSLTGIFKSMFNADFFKNLLIGSGIILALTKYFSDDKFKQQVNDMLTEIRKAFISDEGWMKFKQGIADVGKTLLLLGGTLVAFKLALAYLSGMMYRIGAGGYMPGPIAGPAGRNRPSRGRAGSVWSKAKGFATSRTGMLTALGVGSLAYAGSSMQDWADEPVSTSPQGIPAGAAGYEQFAQAPEQTNGNAGTPTNWWNVGLQASMAPFAISQASSMSRNITARGMKQIRNTAVEKGATQKWINVIKKFRSRGWGGRLLAKLQIKLTRSVLGKKILKRAVAFVAGLFAPGPGWVSSLITGIFLVMDIIWIIDIISEIYTELEKEDAQKAQAKTAAKASEKAPNQIQSGSTESSLAMAFRTIAETASAAFPWLAPMQGLIKSNLFGGGASEAGLKGVRESATAKEAMEFFQSKGWTKEQAAGIVGNLWAESKLKTDALGDGGRAYGIAQWHPDRQQRFKQVFGKSIREAGIKEQMEFVDWELRNSEKRAGDGLKRINSAPDAAEWLDETYERSAGWHRAERMDYAKTLAAQDYPAENVRPPMKAAAAPASPKPTAPHRLDIPKYVVPALAKSGKLPDFMHIDNSTQVINAPSSGTPAAAPMPSTYNPEMYGLSYLSRANIY